MTTTLTQPVNQQLRDLRVANKREQKQVAETLGVDTKSVRRWDTGHTSPRIAQACAYAALFDHTLAVTRDGTVVGDLEQAMEDLALFRHTIDRSRHSAAVNQHTPRSFLADLERRIRAGQPVLLATLERYMHALGCHIKAVPNHPNGTTHMDDDNPAIWGQQAACRNKKPELFFPTTYTESITGEEIARARAICNRCPVKRQCLAWAVDTDQKDGIWGGATPLQRARMRTSRIGAAA